MKLFLEAFGQIWEAEIAIYYTLSGSIPHMEKQR